MKKIILFTGIFLLIAFAFSSAKAQSTHPKKIMKSVYSDVTKKLIEIEPVPYGLRNQLWKNKVVPNKFNFYKANENFNPVGGPDPVLQNQMKALAGEPILEDNFAGISNNYGVVPPDTEGDVGPDHYFQMVNLGFAIWDKDGTLLYGPVDNSTLWSGLPHNSNDGDPVVLYDEYADRWLASQFSLPNYPNGPFYEMIAVSKTGDPTGAWNRYVFQFDDMPDYPKLGVWPDGYYLTINQFSSGSLNFVGGGVCVLDRDAMINGEDEATMIFFDMGADVFGLLAADADGSLLPPENSPAPVISLGSSSLKMWEVTTDWNNVDNSTIDFIGYLDVEYFTNNGISISQPGTTQKLADLADRLMHRLQYRNFGDYQVLLTNHTVNANGEGQAGIRWYELRNEGAGWAIYQQGTYAPDDGNGRWMGSIAMNDNGEIALGYSVSGSTTYPSIRVVMQSAEKLMGLGVMDVDEITCKAGTKSQTGVDRWGDYSAMTIDPADGKSFWYTTEYTNGGWNWRTQITSFFYVKPLTADFTAEETLIPVGESIDFTDQTGGTPESWSWTFEGGTPSTSTEQNPANIVYNEEGTFNVTLSVENEYGSDINEKTDYITTSSTVLPEVIFMADKDLVCTTDTVHFTDQSIHKPNQWLWQFDPSTVTFVNGTDQTSPNPEVVFTETGTYTATLQVWNLNGSSELTKESLITSGGLVPYYRETFVDTEFVSKYWTVENPDQDNGWQQYIVSGNDFDNNAVGIDFKDFDAVGHRDRIITPPLNLTGMSAAALEFQHAYAKRLIKETDSMIVYVSGDCGQSWTRIFAGGEDGSGNFATHEITSEFWPVVESDWCLSGWGASCFSFDISEWAGLANVKIAFEGYNNYGNPLFIDNVTISQYVGQNELIASQDELLIYPNPNSGSFSIQLPEKHKFEKLQLINNVSQVVYKTQLSEKSTLVNIQPEPVLTPGIYFLQLGGKGTTVINKVVVN